MKRLLATAALVGATTITCVNLATAQEMYLGEVRLFGFNFCPTGWAPAAGQLLAISSNTALFSLYGTFYGGNGTTTFALPDLRGRAPYNQGQGPGLPNYTIGEVFGTTNTTLNVAQMPAHTHTGTINATTAGDTINSPAGALLPTFPMNSRNYAASGSPANTPMAAGTITTGPTGGNQPFSIQSPALTMNWCVATVGIYPSRP
jgi:microcystin-dependent protein